MFESTGKLKEKEPPKRILRVETKVSTSKKINSERFSVQRKELNSKPKSLLKEMSKGKKVLQSGLSQRPEKFMTFSKNVIQKEGTPKQKLKRKFTEEQSETLKDRSILMPRRSECKQKQKTIGKEDLIEILMEFQGKGLENRLSFRDCIFTCNPFKTIKEIFYKQNDSPLVFDFRGNNLHRGEHHQIIHELSKLNIIIKL